MGALDVRPSLDAPQKVASRVAIRKLEYLMDAADRIETGAPIPAQLDDAAPPSIGCRIPNASEKRESFDRKQLDPADPLQVLDREADRIDLNDIGAFDVAKTIGERRGDDGGPFLSHLQEPGRDEFPAKMHEHRELES